MTDKQIIIDYKNLCENYNKEVGCYYTFYGSCIKEQCFTYKLLQQLQAKEQECEELTSKCSQLKQTLTEIKEIAEEQIGWNIANLNTNGKSQLLANRILQKISECEGNDE